MAEVKKEESLIYLACKAYRKHTYGPEEDVLRFILGGRFIKEWQDFQEEYERGAGHTPTTIRGKRVVCDFETEGDFIHVVVNIPTHPYLCVSIGDDTSKDVENPQAASKLD